MNPIAKIYKKLSEVPEIIMSFFKIGSSSQRLYDSLVFGISIIYSLNVDLICVTIDYNMSNEFVLEGLHRYV